MSPGEERSVRSDEMVDELIIIDRIMKFARTVHFRLLESTFCQLASQHTLCM